MWVVRIVLGDLVILLRLHRLIGAGKLWAPPLPPRPHSASAPGTAETKLFKIPCLSGSFSSQLLRATQNSNISPTVTLTLSTERSEACLHWRASLPGEVSSAGPAQTENNNQPLGSNSSLHGNCSIALVSLTIPTVLFQAGAKLQLSCDHQGNTQFPLQKYCSNSRLLIPGVNQKQVLVVWGNGNLWRARLTIASLNYATRYDLLAGFQKKNQRKSDQENRQGCPLPQEFPSGCFALQTIVFAFFFFHLV